MSQRDPVTDRGLLAAVVPQMAPGSSAQRFFAVVQKVFRAEVRHHTRGRVTLVGELRETFLEPFIPAQKGELRNELKGQLESSGERRAGGYRSATEDYLVSSSGGGRRPGYRHRNYGHSNATSFLDTRGRNLITILLACFAIYRLLKSGFRFSLNAVIPSCASSDTNTRPIASRSIASPMSSGAP